MNKDFLNLKVYLANLPDFEFAFSLEVQFKGEQSFNLNFNLALIHRSWHGCSDMKYVLSGCTGAIML